MRFIVGILFFLFISLNLNAQKITLIAPNANTTCNTTVDIPLKVKGFQQLLSLQGTIGWDASKLRFQSISSYGPSSLNLGAGNFGTNATANGYVTFSWNDADVSGETLADSTTIFTLRFTVIANVNSTCAIQLLNIPTAFEAININLNSLSFQVVNGNVNITCSSQTNLGLIFPSIAASCNTIIDIPLKVKAFQGIKSLQGVLSWDPTKLQYQSISSYGPTALSISASNFTTTNIANGKLYFSWNDADQSGETLSDSTVLFTFRVSVLSSGVNTSSFLNLDTSPVGWSASSITSTSIPVLLTNGHVNINCTSSSLFQFILPSTTATCGNFVDLPVRIKSFVNILSMQGSIGWDPSKLQFQSIVFYGSPSLLMDSGNFGTQSVASGKLSFSWNDNDLGGESLSDSSIVFTVRFTVLSTTNETTAIEFLNNPTPIEVVNGGYNTLVRQLTNGNVSISCNQITSVSLILPTLSPACFTTVDVPVKVKDFISILSCQGSINWNSSVLQYQSISGFGPAAFNIGISNFGVSDVANGKLSFSWNDNDLTGESLADSSTLFTVRYLVIGSNNNNASIQFTNTPTSIEIVKTGLMTLQPALSNGNIIVFCNASSNFQFIAPTLDVSCSSSVDIPIRVKNFQNIFSFQGSLVWNFSLLQYQSIVSFGPSQFGLSASNFGLNYTSNGSLTFSWSDPDLTGETLADSVILFTLRFSTLGTNGASSFLNFNNSPTPIEVINASLLPVQYNLINGFCTFSCESRKYTFIGNGNWQEASNWQNYQIPPSILPSGEQIIIDPIVQGECILSQQQIISNGATLRVNPAKKLRIVGNLNISD